METIDLKSPVFQARPGWGGKLKNWLIKNSNRLLPLAVIVVVLILFNYLSSSYTAPTSLPENNSDAGVVGESVIEKTADKGQGIAHLSREALEDYLKENPTLALAPAQKVFVETYFIKLNEYRDINVGEKIIFQKEDLAEAIKKARSLTPEQMKMWMRYARTINFQNEI